MLTNHQRVTQYYNSRVKPKEFKERDLVPRLATTSNPNQPRGKLAPTWEGPYKVVKLIRLGTYHLQTLSGTPIPRAWNAANLRKYY